MNFQTEQEAFWAGSFGDEYSNRNKGPELLASNLHFFSKALRQTTDLKTCIEFGANIGMNLRAIKLLYPKMQLHAVEINTTAAHQLRSIIPSDNIHITSILEFQPNQQWDLTLIKGVLIHIAPNSLNIVYDSLFASSKRYILIAEYYNPTPMAITYRGHTDRLFKRDFAGEILDRFPSLTLIDYGFSYHRDAAFPQDDITWFLLKKSD